MFPTKVLLATDGSAEAERMAKAVPERLYSELHVVRVAPMPDPGVRPEATFFDRNLLVQTREQAESEGRAVLDAQRDKLEEVGAEIAGSHLRHAHCPVFVVALADALQGFSPGRDRLLSVIPAREGGGGMGLRGSWLVLEKG